MSTICAVSTPLTEGGLAVIRISGDNAIGCAERIFKPFGDKKVSGMPGYTCAYGRVIDPENGSVLDDAMLTVFRAPKSYTGEDTAEISCHGGVYIARQVLRLCLANGCTQADRGEFTKRAFLNGKLSLTQAEAVMEMISARGEQALRSARLTREGRLFERIDGIKKQLVTLLGELAAWVDYPEEDLPAVSSEAIESALTDAGRKLERLIRDYDCGMVFRRGIDTVIAGKPNVGKSTLMNALLGYERSIVTEAAGTTRDVIEETVRLGDIELRLSDTAGIRGTDDRIEQIGVSLAKKRLEECSLVIAVFDTSSPLDGEDLELIDEIRRLGKKLVIVLNKSDLGGGLDRSAFEGIEARITEISAKHGEGLDELREAVAELFGADEYDADSTIFANERQKRCAEGAREKIAEALEAVRVGETLDAVTVMIDAAASELMELTGEKATEATVDEVFAKFCVGK
ncbi:MAG: tRNA uridine-5-carboxymethylaminomethyl(34) synthesis GTPase MnmE [Ruminococcus sp.]|nr:tRNA uridine-5-carboxymethylaminomethyl(34) synthesis GTPase MnmE [Ruminococcus sp.]